MIDHTTLLKNWDKYCPQKQEQIIGYLKKTSSPPISNFRYPIIACSIFILSAKDHN